MVESKFDYDERQRREEDYERSLERRARFTPHRSEAEIQEAILAQRLKEANRELQTIAEEEKNYAQSGR